MKPVAEIFSQGEELVCGQIVDSNAAWLSVELLALGFRVSRHTAVGDDLTALSNLFSEIAQRADCCICTGGLGPTLDDLTVAAVSLASGLALNFDDAAWQQIQQYFQNRGRPAPESNRKQALLPATALRIDNPVGTAPGFALQYRRCWFVFLPGVPLEMKAMYAGQIKTLLSQRFALQPDSLVILKSVGIGESTIQQFMNGLCLPPQVQLGFRASTDEVQTKLLFPAGYPIPAKQALVAQVAALIGDYIYGIDGLDGDQGDLPAVIDKLMQSKHYNLAVLESLSHGFLAAKCIGKPWLQAADIALTTRQLSEKWLISFDDANPAATAGQLAEQLRRQNHTDLALVQLYKAAEHHFSDRREPVVLYNAVCSKDKLMAAEHQLAGTPQQKQNFSAQLTLDLLRRFLQYSCP